MKVLVAGVGNVLRGDDGFGVVVAQRLGREALPPGVRVLELGIGGIHLVQELLEGFDALVVVDALDLGRSPGTVAVIRPSVPDVASLPLTQRHDQLADMHYATPERAFMLAAAMRVLPDSTWIVGCQIAGPDRYGEGLSAALEGAVDTALAEVRRLVSELGPTWPTAAADRLPAGAPGSSGAIEEAAMPEEPHREQRKTEQGDELTEEHSIAAEEDQPENPYRPARQPAQDQAGDQEPEADG